MPIAELEEAGWELQSQLYGFQYFHICAPTDLSSGLN